MSDDLGQLGVHVDNTHRSLQELVSVNAWFVQDKESPNRFTLHADVSFSEERMGGDATTQVLFKLAIKRCDIVFALPATAPFRVDASSVRSPKPLNPKKVLHTESSKTSLSAKGKVGVEGQVPTLSGNVEASHDWQRAQVSNSEQSYDLYHELWKKVRGNHAWSVDGRELERGRLAGPVFDAEYAPRLTILDGRSEETRERDTSNNLFPVAAIKVPCLREDIDIYEIAYKDPAKQKIFETGKHRAAKLATAREVLKEAILREGLVAGDIANDPYAEMIVCDVSITINDDSS